MGSNQISMNSKSRNSGLLAACWQAATMASAAGLLFGAHSGRHCTVGAISELRRERGVGLSGTEYWMVCLCAGA